MRQREGRRGTKIIVHGAGFSTASMTVSKTGRPSTVSPRFAGVTRRPFACHILAAFSMERAGFAGDALANDAGMFVDQNAHSK